MRIVLWGGPCDGQEHDVVLPLPPSFDAIPPIPAGTLRLPSRVSYLITPDCVRQRRVYVYEGVRKLVEA